MANAKHALKRKRGAKAVPVLGAAGLLSLAGGASVMRRPVRVGQAGNALLIAANGKKLTDDERTIFQTFTDREREPGEHIEEFVAVEGRRAGRSGEIGAVQIPSIAGLCKHPELSRGETGVRGVAGIWLSCKSLMRAKAFLE